MNHVLAWIVAAPAIAAAILLALPASSRLAIRVVSLVGALVSCALSISVATAYDRTVGGLQMGDDWTLVPSMGIHLKFAVDGWGVPHFRVDYEAGRKTNLFATIGPATGATSKASNHRHPARSINHLNK